MGEGNGDQYIIVAPDLDLLVVVTAGNYNSNDPAHVQLFDRLLGDYLLPAAGLVDAEFVED